MTYPTSFCAQLYRKGCSHIIIDATVFGLVAAKYPDRHTSDAAVLGLAVLSGIPSSWGKQKTRFLRVPKRGREREKPRERENLRTNPIQISGHGLCLRMGKRKTCNHPKHITRCVGVYIEPGQRNPHTRPRHILARVHCVSCCDRPKLVQLPRDTPV